MPDVDGAAQILPHWPQFSGSVVRFLHVPEHPVSLARHVRQPDPAVLQPLAQVIGTGAAQEPALHVLWPCRDPPAQLAPEPQDPVGYTHAPSDRFAQLPPQEVPAPAQAACVPRGAPEETGVQVP